MSDMESQGLNKGNQFVDFLEQGKDVPKAVKSKEIVDIRKELKSKYPGVPMPDPNRIIRTVSSKQQRGIKRE